MSIFFLDFDTLLNTLVGSFSAGSIFFVFLISETILGLIPPEIFIAWSSKSNSPWLFLFILAAMSYLGGVIAYVVGSQLNRIPAIRNHLENKISVHVKNLKKWGGLFILVGALLPLPHSMVSMACGLIRYNLTNYLMWALFRFLRFGFYALIIFQVF